MIKGKSGCGKTTLLINLLLRPDWVDYNNINLLVKGSTDYLIVPQHYNTDFGTTPQPR